MWTRKGAAAPFPGAIPNCSSSLKSSLVGSYPGRAEQTDSEGIYSSGLWTKPKCFSQPENREYTFCTLWLVEFSPKKTNMDSHGILTISQPSSFTHFWNKTQQCTSDNAMDWCLPGLSPWTPAKAVTSATSCAHSLPKYCEEFLGCGSVSAGTQYEKRGFFW